MPRTAHAQFAAYGSIAITTYGIDPIVSSTPSYKSGTPGFVVGGFYNFPIESRLTAGLDLRLQEAPGGKGGTAGAIAFRLGFVPHVVPLRPYFDIGGGYLNTSTNTELVNDQVRAGTYSGGSAIFAFGLDIRVTHALDIRAIDIGSQATNSAGTVYADAGVVYHFGPRTP